MSELSRRDLPAAAGAVAAAGLMADRPDGTLVIVEPG
jgi:hypothetical protein